MFNFREKITNLFNSIFGSNVENTESKDDPTLYEELKGAADTFISSTNTKIQELTEKVDASATMQTEFNELKTKVQEQETKISGYESKIEQMQKDFNKNLVDLKSEVRKELAGESKSKENNSNKTLDEVAGEGKNKELVFDLWGANKAKN